MSFAAKMMKENALVCELRTEIEQVPVFAILQIDRMKYRQFQHKMDHWDGSMRLEDYGTVLHKGVGEPGEAIKADMYEKFRLYHEEFETH